MIKTQASFLIRCIETDGKLKFVVEHIQKGDQKFTTTLLEALLWIEEYLLLILNKDRELE
jgi:hypothetical protein